MAIPFAGPLSGFARRQFSTIYRRYLSKSPTSISPESDVAWQERQFRYYATNLPFASPLTLVRGNLTGETWEMRAAYREWSFKEPALKASLLTKCLAVAQLSPQVLPASRSPRDKEAAKWIDWAVANSDGGWPGLIMNMLLPALIDGFSICEKVWGHVDEFGPYHRRWTMTQAASIDTADTRFRLDTYRQIVGVHSINGTQSGAELDPKTFIIFTHLKIFENPFGISDVRAAVRACRLIESAFRLRHLLLTNHSGPFLMAKAGDPTTRSNLIKIMDNARANGWIVVPTGTELEVLNLATASIDTFRSTIEDYQQEIVRAIHGAYLQLLEGGIANGRGNTNVHNSVSQLFQWWLSVLVCQHLNKQLVRDLIEPSYGYQSGLPRISLEGIDESAVMAALDKFKKGQELGIVMSEEQVREVGGFELPSSDADKLKPPAAQQPPDPFGLGGGGGNDGGPNPPDDPNSSLFADEFVSANKLPTPGDVRELAVQTFRGITTPGEWVLDENTSLFVEWKAYTNPKTQKAGWISENGKVSYTAPKQQDAKPKAADVKAASQQAVGAVAQKIQAGQSITHDDVKTLGDHLPNLTVKQFQDIKAALGAKIKAKKKGDMIAGLVGSTVDYLKAKGKPDTPAAPASSPPPTPAPEPKPADKTKTVAAELPPAPGKPAGKDDKDVVESAVKTYLAANGAKATDVLATGQFEKISGLLKKAGYTNGTVGHFEVKYALDNLKTQEADSLIPPAFAKYGAKNKPNPLLPPASRPKLTDPEQAAVQKYTGSSYRPLNKELRDTGKPPAGFAQMHAELQSAFAKAAKLDPPVTVVRGMTLNGPELKKFMDNIKSAAGNGNELQLNGYISTSAKGDTAAPPSLFDGNVRLVIKATHGIDALPYTHHPHEQEMLVNHGSRFKVGKIETVGGKTQIHLEQIHPSEWAAVSYPTVPAASNVLKPQTPAATPQQKKTDKGFFGKLFGKGK